MSNETLENVESTDPNAIFRMGTWIGRPYDEIESSGFFGTRISPRARQGSWNVPHRLDYGRRTLQSEEPYETHVGFFENKEAAYFLFQKRALNNSNTINEVEVKGLLFRVASGGEWSEGVKGEHRSIWAGQNSDNAADFTGTFYEYTQKVGDNKFRLFAYILHNKKQLLIWPPAVTPNLFGTSFAPNVELESVEVTPEDGGEVLLEEATDEVDRDVSMDSDPFAT